MRIRDVMTPGPFTVRPSTSVFDARREMSSRKIRHLLVTASDGLLLGVVTDRDIRSNLPSPASSLSVWEVNYLLGRLTVGEIMTRLVITIGPERDIAEAARIMIEHKIGSLPVMEGRDIVGLVTDTDLLRALAQGARTLAAAS